MVVAPLRMAVAPIVELHRIVSEALDPPAGPVFRHVPNGTNRTHGGRTVVTYSPEDWRHLEAG